MGAQRGVQVRHDELSMRRLSSPPSGTPAKQK